MEIDACVARLAACCHPCMHCLPAKGWEGWAKVVDVYNGGTFDVVAHVAGPFASACRFPVRVAGIIAFDMDDTDPDGQAMAIATRDRLLELLLSTPPPRNASRSQVRDAFDAETSTVHLRVRSMDKHGRAIGDVTLPASGRSVAGFLLQERLVMPFDGSYSADCNARDARHEPAPKDAAATVAEDLA